MDQFRANVVELVDEKLEEEIDEEHTLAVEEYDNAITLSLNDGSTVTFHESESEPGWTIAMNQEYDDEAADVIVTLLKEFSTNI